MSGAPARLPGQGVRCAQGFRPGAARAHHTGWCRSGLQGARRRRLAPRAAVSRVEHKPNPAPRRQGWALPPGLQSDTSCSALAS